MTQQARRQGIAPPLETWFRGWHDKLGLSSAIYDIGEKTWCCICRHGIICIGALALIAGCGGAVYTPLPPECQPAALISCGAPNGSYTWCDDLDGSRWLIGPTEWGYEHVDPNGCRICRVWSETAWATGPTADQEAHGCAAPVLVSKEEE